MHRRVNFQSFKIAALMVVFVMFSFSLSIAQSSPNLPTIKKKAIKAATQPPGKPDLTISNYELTRQGNTLNYTLTFKNIGDGPAGCFDYLAMDSLKGIKTFDVCEGKPATWKLTPGREVTIIGAIQRSDMWVWPDERGYMSKLRFNANHGSKVNETDITNNHTQFKAIYWDANIIQNAY